jgi:dTDP-4-amino-4,6-dideoxygalactose transaminase
MDGIWSLAARHNLFVLEDCAHANETQYKGRPVGARPRPDAPGGGSRFAAYSFYATKNLICGEGGMLACQREADLERSRVISLHGMSSNAWKRYSGEKFSLYDIVEPGFKYNMFELQAALGLVQLGKIEANLGRRRALCAHYDGLIGATFGDAEAVPLRVPEYGRSAHHLYIVRVARDIDRNRVIEELLQRNVQAYVHYIALNGTQLYREQLGNDPAETPVAAQAGARSITLPLFPTMSEGDAEYCVAMLKESIEAAR